MPPLSPPPGTTAVCQTGFGNYLAARTEAKAFAVNPQGHCGWQLGGQSPEDAKQTAMSECAKRGAGCALYAVGQALAGH
jgi:hypothetical protein